MFATFFDAITEVYLPLFLILCIVFAVVLLIIQEMSDE